MSQEYSRVFDIAAAGELVLFLGAGAIAGSTIGKQNRPALMGNSLRDELQTRFFPEEGQTSVSLKRVCTSIQNLKGANKLREVLTDLLIPVNPSRALSEIPKVPWRAIYSVNVDDSVERAYEAAQDRAQNLHPIVLPDDTAARDPSCDVNYYKLHGCLRRSESSLIFSHRDYTESRETNLRMFTSLARDLCDCPMLFIGFSFEDDDFQDVWQSVLRYRGSSRRSAPTFLVTRSSTPSLVESMEVDGIEVISSGVEDFFSTLRANLPKRAPSVSERVHERVAQSQALIQQAFGKTVDESLLDKIRANFDLVRQLPETNKDPTSSRFLLGANPTWADIQLGLAIPRELEEDVQDDLETWLNKPSFKTSLIVSGAGYGKSTLLMRLAYEFSKQHPQTEVLVKKPTGDADATSVAEYALALGVPVLLVVDDAFRCLGTLRRLKLECDRHSIPIYLLAAARPADWNRARKAGAFDIPARTELARLSKDESRELAKTMRRYGNLNSELQSASLDELAGHFFDRGEKHLLAGLLTASVNGSYEFEKIISDEYFRIPEGKARDIYLNVSLIHSLGLSTPATLACASVDLPLAEYHGTCAPLLDTTIIEHQDDVSRDLLFKTQHRVIAETLIESVVKPASAVDRILSIAANINPHFREQYNILLRLYDEEYLSSILVNPGTVRSCYEQLMENFPADVFIRQHYAIFESHEKNFAKAHHLIDESLQLRPGSAHFLNTKANILLREAAAEADKGRAEHLFVTGTNLLRERIQKDADKEIHYLSLIERQLEWARRNDLTREQRLNILEDAESDLDLARVRYPLSSDISTVTAKLMLQLWKIPDAKTLLEKSVRLDGANIRARILLARILIDQAQTEEALHLVQDGLPNSQRNYGLLRLRLDCLRELKRPWVEVREALKAYLAVAEDDFVERMQLIKGLIENGDLAAVVKHAERLRKSDVSHTSRLRNTIALGDGTTPFIVEGEYYPTGIAKGFLTIDGYPKQLGAYIDRRSLRNGERLFANKRMRAVLAINGFGLVATKIL